MYRGSRTIVLAPKWLGDTIMALPVLEAISENRPEGVDILAAEAMERLLKATRLFRLVLPKSNSFWGDRRLMKVAGYDEAFILPNSFRSALLPFLSGVSVRRGYSTDGRRLLLSEPLPHPGRGRHQIFDYDGLLGQTGLARERDEPRLQIPEGFLEAGRATLAAAGIDPTLPFVGLNPGGIGIPEKRWAIDRFGALGVSLVREGIPVVVYGGSGDAADARAIAAISNPPLPVVGPDDDCLGLAALLAPCRLLVTNDSGGMHLGAALGVRCVAMFGPTDPARTSPAGDGHRVIRRATMDEISVDEVLGATRELFSLAVADEAPRRSAAD